jgi:hypothetical protein
MSAKQPKATDQIREHVDRAHDAIDNFRRDGISAHETSVSGCSAQGCT